MATPARLEEVEKNASPNNYKEAAPRAKVSKKGLAIALAGVAIIGSLGYWLHARHFESTDDAQVDGHFAQLSTRVTGTVTYVNPLVENDRFVSAGTRLLELDPRDYEAELEHAKATLETKQARFHGAELQVPITDASAFSQLHLAEAARQEAVASVAAAEADLTAAQHRVQQDQAVADRAERDRVRYAALVEKRGDCERADP
jgi:membrane fusion protein (multidrug efflux system)